MAKRASTGDLGAAIDGADRKAIVAAATFVFVVGALIVAAAAVKELRDAHAAERAEWAFACRLFEEERDELRARFTAGPGGEVVDEEADDV